MYKKPLYRPAPPKKERPGKVHHLTKDQIIRDYGMKAFGTAKGGTGLFDRVKKGPGYLYYKATPKVDDYTLEALKKPHANKTEEARAPGPSAAPGADSASPAPESTLNVSLKVTWDINLNLNGLKGLFK